MLPTGLEVLLGVYLRGVAKGRGGGDPPASVFGRIEQRSKDLSEHLTRRKEGRR